MLLLIGGIGILMGLPVIWHALMFSRSVSSTVAAPLLQTDAISGVVVSVFGICATFVYLLGLYKKKSVDVVDYMILAFLLTGFVIVNQHLFTGQSIQSGHYHWYFNSPIFVGKPSLSIKQSLFFSTGKKRNCSGSGVCSSLERV